MMVDLNNLKPVTLRVVYTEPRAGGDYGDRSAMKVFYSNSEDCDNPYLSATGLS